MKVAKVEVVIEGIFYNISTQEEEWDELREEFYIRYKDEKDLEKQVEEIKRNYEELYSGYDIHVYAS